MIGKAIIDRGVVVSVLSKAHDGFYYGIVITFDFWLKGMKKDYKKITKEFIEYFEKRYAQGYLLPVAILGSRICRYRFLPNDFQCFEDAIKRYAYVDTSKDQVAYFPDLDTLLKILYELQHADNSLARYIHTAICDMVTIRGYMQNPKNFVRNDYMAHILKEGVKINTK
jgi:hypothetical protein